MSRLLISEVFNNSLRLLSPAEREAVRGAARTLHRDLLGPDRAPSAGLVWAPVPSGGEHLYSVAPTSALRLIVHHAGEGAGSVGGPGDYALLYAGAMAGAYRWAQKQALRVHPVTGAMQLVEALDGSAGQAPAEGALDEQGPAAVGTAPPPTPGPAAPSSAPLFAAWNDAELLALGLPPEQLPAVRAAVAGDLPGLLARVPQAAGERLVSLLTGESVPPPAAPTADPFLHPDAQASFRVVRDEAELEAALQGSWAAWTVFLHPSQQRAVTRSFSEAGRVTGAAGTGKTVVALHRAARLARAGGQVLLTTFTRTLAAHLDSRLGLLLPEPELRARVTVRNIHAEAMALAKSLGLKVSAPLSESEVSAGLARAALELGYGLEADFLYAEWRYVIEARALRSWEAYRDTPRTGRGTPLGLRGRQQVWAAAERFRGAAAGSGRFTWASLCGRVTERLAELDRRPPGEGPGGRGRVRPAYDHVIADEAQDFGPSELSLLLSLAPAESAPGREPLLLALDERQRIYQPGSPLRALGLNFQGRSVRLRVNYRTSEETRRFAERVLEGAEAGDDPGFSRFHGPEPVLHGAGSLDAEYAWVATWLRARMDEGARPEELAVFTRHRVQDAALALHAQHGLRTHVVQPERASMQGAVCVATMHNAKGLEFRAVAVMGMSEGRMPSEKHLAGLSDPADREDLLAQERHLLYVAVTRARDQLALTWSGEPSPFLAPLLPVAGAGAADRA